jgi:hypothetical protein
MKRFILLLIIGGYTALFMFPETEVWHGETLCLFRTVFHIPCPSCGTGHAMQVLLRDGDVGTSLMLNPFGIVVIALTIVTAFIIVSDLLKKGRWFETILQQFHLVLKRRPVLGALLILLVLLNWGWNFYKSNG